MVLQRELPVPVWGQAAPGEKITVKFRKQEKSVSADKDGKWLIRLDPLTAGGPDKLIVSGTNTLTIEEVLVGEVWLGSGQSNMAGTVGSYAKGDEVLAAAADAAPYPRLRLLTSKPHGRWEESTTNDVRQFSALLFYFGLRLQKELNVPVGLIVGAVGGTPSGCWLSEDALKSDTSCQVLIQKYAGTFSDTQKKYDETLAKWQEAAAAAKEQEKPEPKRPSPPPKPGETARGKVGHLYEAHIRPFIPYAIRGVLWDQGEAGTGLGGVDQYTLMGALIRSWRRDWGQGDFPFLYIQKPSGGGCAWDPQNPITRNAEPFQTPPATVPNDGGFVENHILIMRYPNTAMVISSDLGGGVHPTNKSGYSHRASDVALGMVYGRKFEYYGPVYDSHVVEGNKVRIHFKHMGQGLVFRHGDKLQGFAIAGADKVFHWGDALIDGQTVVVSSEKVSQPVAVRYAWSTKRTWANLFNKDGLPALPFRTDQW